MLKEINIDQIIAKLFSNLNPKESHIIGSRFGLKEKEKQTLEELGNHYNLSKERIRQIQNQALQKIRQVNYFEELIKPAKEELINFLNQKGGLITEDFIIKKSDNAETLIFIMSEFFPKDLERLDSHPKLESSWKLKTVTLGLIEKVLEEALNIIRNKKSALGKEELLNLLKKSSIYKKHDLDDSHIISYLEASRDIKENVLGQYGLAFWREIVPKRISDKIYLVFQKSKKPLHFNEITQEINGLGFDQKKANHRTVHNELILDNRFILIGRGIYALKEWGYQGGTVKELLKDILAKEKKPLSKEELIKKLQDQRIIKESTVYAALADKNVFKKVEGEKYVLAKSV